MRRELVEEVYEMLEAIDDGNVAGMREEMGDVLLQVVFHARLAEEEGLFAMQDVIDDVVKKLVHRHPHVFGSTRVSGAGEVMANWETLKAQEKTERTMPWTASPRDCRPDAGLQTQRQGGQNRF